VAVTRTVGLDMRRTEPGIAMTLSTARISCRLRTAVPRLANLPQRLTLTWRIGGVTSTAETKSERDSGDATFDDGSPLIRTDVSVRAHLVVASLFLVAAVAMLAIAAAKLVWPDLLDGTAALSYGRLVPMGLNALVFGWLTIALTGVAYYVVPRAAGAPLAYPLVALGNLAVMGAGVGLGVGGIGLGRNSGGRLTEMPLEADGLLLVSFFVSAVIITTTARRGAREALPLSCWYLVAAPWWLVASYAIGAVPGATGLPAEIQAAFSATAVTGLWVVAAGVGAGYHLLSRVVPDAAFNPDLGRIGFWSLAFTWLWTTGMSFQYGPTNDWFETIPVVFGAGLVLATVTIAADMAGALRGRWSDAVSSVPFRLLAAGSVLFALVPLQMLLQSFRSVSVVVRFTQFEVGLDLIGFAGAFTLWAMALGIHALGAERGGRVASWGGWAILIPVAAGVGLAATSRWIAGFQQGLAWLATVQSREGANAGDGFRSSIEGLRAADMAHVVGLGLIGLGAAAFLAFTIALSLGGSAAPGSEPSAELTTNRLATVLRGAALLFVVGALGSFVFPALDSRAEASPLAERSRPLDDGSLAAIGRALYVTEGCMYCHTQEVRAAVPDVGLGRVSTAGDYVFDPVGILGHSRLGPDLAHAGSRQPTDSARWVLDHLADPRAARPWSNMPSYRHLTSDELTALAVYVAGLE
jgi:cytochrome c oxidase cbb3-type subunit I